MTNINQQSQVTNINQQSQVTNINQQSQVTNINQIVALLDKVQVILNQCENIATGALGQPSPLVTIGMTQAAWTNFQPFLDSLTIPELPPLGGDGTVQMTQDQFGAWRQYIAQDPNFPAS